MNNQTFEIRPSVLAFQRSMLVTDGAFFNMVNGRYQDQPLAVVRHGVRATQNIAENEDPQSSKDSDHNANNIQTTETSKTSHDSSGLVVAFGFRLLSLDDGLFACASEDSKMAGEFRASVEAFIERTKTSQGLLEVCRRYARNIANGSWLWRNRTSASDIQVIVTTSDTNKELARFNAFKIPTNHFNDYTPEEIALADFFSAGLRGERRAGVQVSAIVDFGVKGSVEVFPSQCYIEGKPKGFARPLYKVSSSLLKQEKDDKTDGSRVMGQAGFRDQKISNRLRTIDTWYSAYELVGHPIPVEPNGASLEYSKFFRSDKEGTSLFGMLNRLNTMDPNTEEGMFVIAAMIRGGVFNGASQKKAKEKAAKEAKASGVSGKKAKLKAGAESSTDVDGLDEKIESNAADLTEQMAQNIKPPVLGE